MSLQVWLPLNGNIKNQGLNQNITITNSGATVNTAGKLGQCYNFTSSYLTLNNFNMSSKPQMSFCFWCCPTTASLAYVFTTKQNTLVQFAFSGTNNFTFRDTKHSTLTSVSFTAPMANIWTHYAFVYDKGSWIIYKDGVKDGTGFVASSAATLNANYNNCWIGYYNPTAGNQYYKGKLNDFRLYDHALSEKEVQEIVKGLVVHYKLDNGNPNLIDPEYYNVAPWNNAITGREYDNEYGNILLVRNSTLYTASSSGTTALFPITFIENTQYTISVDWRDDLRTDGKNSSLYLRFDYTDGSTRSSIISPASSKTYWTHSKLTSNANKTVSKITTTYGNGGIVKIANLKIEIGTQETRYIGNNNTVYDYSGYQNNATNVNCIASNDTAKYDKSIAQKSGQYIRSLGRPNNFLPHDAITVNLWMKCTTWGNPISCTEGGGFNFEANGDYIYFPIHITHSNGNSYAGARTSITRASLLNNWHMITGVYDGTNTIIYVDGEESGRNTSQYSGTIHYATNYLFIGAEAQGDNTTPANSTFVGNISDVRIYATALSAAAIKDLYKTSAEIDKNGNFYIGSIHETTNTSITKTNISNADNYIEGASVAELTSDAEWNINHVYEI